jgi:CRP-like cAMP-binding protein
MLDPPGAPENRTVSTLFRDLPKSTIDAVYAAGRRLEVDAGEFFCRQGAPATSFHVLLKGRAKLTQVTEDGHQVLVRFLGPGDCCGIIAAHEGSEYQASVEAVEPSAVLSWDRDTLKLLLQRHPDFALNALGVLAEQCQAWQRRYREVTTARVEQRVALTLLRLARQAGRKVEAGVLIALPLSREDLAEMTGTTLYTVSRILSRWEQTGFVELGRRRVVITDGHALMTIAEDGEVQPNPTSSGC